MYQTFVKFGESRSTKMFGPFSFPNTEERQAYVNGDEVYWYHFSEEDDWNLWKRGGAWNATATPGKADVVPAPPQITEDDRW
jgi:hypothetical protein